MCFSSSRLVIVEPELIEKNKNNFKECSKFIYATLKHVTMNYDFNITQAKQLLEEVEKNSVALLKAHYLETNDESYRPYEVDTINNLKFADEYCDSDENRITNLTFAAQYQLRFVTKQLIYVLEQVAEKKRRRRLQYKSNKKRQRQTLV